MTDKVLDIMGIVSAVILVVLVVCVVFISIGAWYHDTYVNVSAVPAVTLVLG